MLRAVADYGRKHSLILKLTGIDANEYTINYARKLSVNYPEISYYKMDIFSEEFSGITFDIAIATLFFHHFTNQEIEENQLFLFFDRHHPICGRCFICAES